MTKFIIPEDTYFIFEKRIEQKYSIKIEDIVLSISLKKEVAILMTCCIPFVDYQTFVNDSWFHMSKEICFKNEADDLDSKSEVTIKLYHRISNNEKQDMLASNDWFVFSQSLPKDEASWFLIEAWNQIPCCDTYLRFGYQTDFYPTSDPLATFQQHGILSRFLLQCLIELHIPASIHNSNLSFQFYSDQCVYECMLHADEDQGTFQLRISMIMQNLPKPEEKPIDILYDDPHFISGCIEAIDHILTCKFQIKYDVEFAYSNFYHLCIYGIQLLQGLL